MSKWMELCGGFGGFDALRCWLFGHRWDWGDALTRHCQRCLRLETMSEEVKRAYTDAWVAVLSGGRIR